MSCASLPYARAVRCQDICAVKDSVKINTGAPLSDKTSRGVKRKILDTVQSEGYASCNINFRKGG